MNTCILPLLTPKMAFLRPFGLQTTPWTKCALQLETQPTMRFFAQRRTSTASVSVALRVLLSFSTVMPKCFFLSCLDYKRFRGQSAYSNFKHKKLCISLNNAKEVQPPVMLGKRPRGAHNALSPLNYFSERNAVRKANNEWSQTQLNTRTAQYMRAEAHRRARARTSWDTILGSR